MTEPTEPQETLETRTRKLIDVHLENAALFERGGNPAAATRLRSVANMLGALVQGDDPLPIFSHPEPTKEIGIAVHGRAGAGKSTVIGVIEQALYHAGVGHLVVQDPDTDQAQRTKAMSRLNCLAPVKVKLIHWQLTRTAGSIFKDGVFEGNLPPGGRYADQPKKPDDEN